MKISVVIIVTYQVRKIKWKRGNESLIRSTLGVTMYMCGEKKNVGGVHRKKRPCKRGRKSTKTCRKYLKTHSKKITFNIYFLLKYLYSIYLNIIYCIGYIHYYFMDEEMED